MFGSFNRRLNRWKDAGVITADQVTGILSFEREYKQGSLSRRLTNVAIFAIGLGLLAIIGSAWEIIPNFLKIAMHAGLNAGVVIYMLRLKPEQQYRRDFCLLALAGLFFTFIVLVAQIYNLHGPTYRMLIFWLGICSPFIWYFGRTYTVALPWLMTLIVTLGFTIVEFGDSRDIWQAFTVLITLYLPIILLIASRSAWLQQKRHGFAAAFETAGLIIPGLATILATFFFYETSREFAYLTETIIGLAVGLIAILLLFKPKDMVGPDSTAAFDRWCYLFICSVGFALPFFFSRIESGLLSAILFIAYFLYFAWLGARVHSQRLTDYSIRLVMLRLFTIFLEVFGGLMVTGWGLVLSGVILIIILKNSRKIVERGRKLVGYEIQS